MLWDDTSKVSYYLIYLVFLEQSPLLLCGDYFALKFGLLHVFIADLETKVGFQKC